MEFLKELKIFVKHIFYWVVSFVGFSVFFFFFGLKKIVVLGEELYLFLPSENSFTVQAFSKVRADLLPQGVELMATNPISAFVAQILLSMLLSFLLTTPFFIYKIILYLQPALYSYERRAIILSVLPLTVLFLSGAAYSYFFLIPTTFKILYPFTINIGATAFFSINEFMHYVFGLTFYVGLMFLLPVFMVLLSWMGIIRAEFWKNKWRFALLLFLIGSAIITPDGTGVTMAMLFIPLMTLYFIGCALADKLGKEV